MHIMHPTTKTQSFYWTWKILSCRTQDETLHICRHRHWCRFGYRQCQSASPSRTSWGEGKWWESIKGWWQGGDQNHFVRGWMNLILHFLSFPKRSTTSWQVDRAWRGLGEGLDRTTCCNRDAEAHLWSPLWPIQICHSQGQEGLLSLEGLVTGWWAK